MAKIQGPTTTWVFYTWIDLRQNICVLHNDMITLNSLAYIIKVNVRFSMFKSKVQRFYLEKILENIDAGCHYPIEN